MTDAKVTRRDRFEALFSADRDPWQFETSEYEREKRKQTLAALGDRRFDRALEVGCATGVLTLELSAICRDVVGIDVAETALEIARQRLPDCANVTFEQGEIPRDWPTGPFDLLLLSEVLYFLSAEEIEEVSARASAMLPSHGVCLLVNWTGPTDLPFDGDEVVQVFLQTGFWRRDLHTRHSRYRIDRLHPA